MESAKYHYVETILVPDPNGDGSMKVGAVLDSGWGGDMRFRERD